ncbi:MAG: hypothetical protein ACOYMM_06005 [Phycisphaerales bacterium]
MNDDRPPVERLRERAADVALHGDAFSLEEIELALELGLDLERETEALELAAAALAVAEIERDRAAASANVPAALKARLAATAAAVVAPAPIPLDATRAAAPARATSPKTSPKTSHAREWMIAAASIALGAAVTAIVLNGDPNGDGATRDPAQFVRTHPRAVHWPWQGTGDAHVVGEVRGEAYFDPDSEDGLLEIEGLAANDPRIEQYQLWIFDAERDQRYPVDGGVFDIREPGRVVIPVKARLDVTKPVQFAITVEKPGGAVVSERRIALVARP